MCSFKPRGLEDSYDFRAPSASNIKLQRVSLTGQTTALLPPFPAAWASCGSCLGLQTPHVARFFGELELLGLSIHTALYQHHRGCGSNYIQGNAGLVPIAAWTPGPWNVARSYDLRRQRQGNHQDANSMMKTAAQADLNSGRGTSGAVATQVLE